MKTNPRLHATPMASATAIALLLGALASSGCVPVETLPLTKPATATAGGLTVETRVVGASTAFLAQRGGEWSVLATTIVATNSSADAYVVGLDQASLVLTDPGGELPEVVVPVKASGRGEAPPAIPLDRGPAPVTVSPGGVVVAWVAFQAREVLDEPGLRRKIVVRIPVSGGGTPIEVVLADPAVERPRWKLRPVTQANYVGISGSGTFDEGSVGFIRSSSRTIVKDTVLIAPALELGARAGKLRGEREPTIACCDLGLSLDVGVPFLRSSWMSVGPTVGYHAIFVLEDGRIDKATWHGPSIGLTFFSSPIEPRVAGALPVRTTPSVLGYSAFSIHYVQWFRRGDEGGSPGGVITFDRSIPEW